MPAYILVLYYSASGNTKRLAEEIALGIEAGGIEAKLRTVPRLVAATSDEREPAINEHGDLYATDEDIRHCKAIAVGSPSRFGAMAGALKGFFDSQSALWHEGALINKPASVFTSSASLHGGQEMTLLNLMVPLLHHGCIIKGVPYSQKALLNTQAGGTPYGASSWQEATSEQQKTELQIAFEQGKELAILTNKLS